jgi:branched-chain amino acid transport system substrate-binding protein
VGLSACDELVSIFSDDEMPQMMGGEISIGVVVPLTGSNAGPYGLSMQRGFEMAQEEINNKQLGDANLTFITVDSRSTIEGTTDAVQKLVDLALPAIIGLESSTQLEKAYPIAHESGVVVFSSLSAAAGLSSLGDFLFRTGLATDILIPAGVMATQEKLGYKKVALIYDAKDLYSTSSYQEVKAVLEAIDVEIVAIETVQTGDTDFSAQLTNIMKLEIDALFISGLAVEITEVIIQGRALGIPDTVHFIVPDLSINEVQKAGGAAEGAITFIGWDGMSNTPGNQKFVQNYQAKYGMEPDAWAAQSYATLYILANAIANAQSTDPAAIRDALAQTMDFPTILGNFSFDPNGEAIYDPIVLIVKDGKLQVFE